MNTAIVVTIQPASPSITSTTWNTIQNVAIMYHSTSCAKYYTPLYSFVYTSHQTLAVDTVTIKISWKRNMREGTSVCMYVCKFEINRQTNRTSFVHFVLNARRTAIDDDYVEAAFEHVHSPWKEIVLVMDRYFCTVPLIILLLQHCIIIVVIVDF